MAHYIPPFEKQRTKGMPLVPSHSKNENVGMGWDGMGWDGTEDVQWYFPCQLFREVEYMQNGRSLNPFGEIVTFLLVSAHELRTITHLDSQQPFQDCRSTILIIGWHSVCQGCNT